MVYEDHILHVHEVQHMTWSNFFLDTGPRLSTALALLKEAENCQQVPDVLTFLATLLRLREESTL